jgi:hypothetical protein
MRASDYVDWSVKALYYAGGVASTVVGSLLSSKIRIYHDARNSHRDELKQKVLEPLRKMLGFYGTPRFTVLHQAQQFNTQASAGESPNTYGPSVTLERPANEPKFDDVLLEDARRHHFRTAIAASDTLKRDWMAQAEHHKTFVETISQEILAASGLPAFPAPAGPYVMHWNLGTFVYNRLVLEADARLWPQAQQDGQVPDCHILNDGQVTVAKGSAQQMSNLIHWVDGVLTGRRQQAMDLKNELRKLEEKRAALSRQLSLAIAEKKLHRRCSLVRFF